MAFGSNWETGTIGSNSLGDCRILYGMLLPRILLASASPRRAELLTSAGFAFDVQPADVDEHRLVGEAPEAYCQRLARTKAEAVAPLAAGRVVVAADTIVVLGQDVMGKPVDHSEARRMLARLSGCLHTVLTGVAVWADDRALVGAIESTSVEFASLTTDEIAWYVASNEPMDKAGAYAIQGLASRFVTRIEGSYSNVVGLPVATLCRLLRKIDPIELERYPESVSEQKVLT